MSSTKRWDHLIAFIRSGIDELDSTKPFTDCCALYGGLGVALTQLETLVQEDFFGDGYAGEKIERIRSDIEIALGIVTSGTKRSDEFYRVQASGQLDSLKKQLDRWSKSGS